MKNVTSPLLMLVMLVLFIQSSQAIGCYVCSGCDEVTSDMKYNCSWDACSIHMGRQSAFRNICVKLCVNSYVLA